MIAVLNLDLSNFIFMKKKIKLFAWYLISGCGVPNKVSGEWGFVSGQKKRFRGVVYHFCDSAALECGGVWQGPTEKSSPYVTS